MAHQIKWAKRADQTLYKQVNYLAEHWSNQVVTEFIDKAYHIIDLLMEFLEMGKILDSDKGICGVLINPYVRLSYRIDDNTVILIRFTDTRQKPM